MRTLARDAATAGPRGQDLVFAPVSAAASATAP